MRKQHDLIEKQSEELKSLRNKLEEQDTELTKAKCVRRAACRRAPAPVQCMRWGRGGGVCVHVGGTRAQAPAHARSSTALRAQRPCKSGGPGQGWRQHWRRRALAL